MYDGGDLVVFFFSSRRRHTRLQGDWSSDVCSYDLARQAGAALLQAAGGDAQRITAELVFRMAADGEPVAAAVVDEACRALGAMLATIVNGLNPEVVVVTGGVAASLPALGERVLAAAARHAVARALAATRITIVPGDKRLTVRGPAALVLYARDPRQA